MTNGISIKRGSTNLFADLGYADPETHLLKAGLVTRIREILNDAKLNQTEAATRIGLGQPEAPSSAATWISSPAGPTSVTSR